MKLEIVFRILQRVEKLSLKIEEQLEITRDLRGFSSRVMLTGSSEPLSIAPYISQIQNLNQALSPQLILVSNEKEAKDFSKDLSFFNPHLSCHVLTDPEPSMRSRAFIDPEFSLREEALRMKWLYRAIKAKPSEVFVISLKALLRKTLPSYVFLKKIFPFKIKQKLPTHFIPLLNQLDYQNVIFVEDPGTYSQRGSLIDLFCPLYSEPLRIELFGDQIQSLRFFNPVNQRSTAHLENFTLIAAKEPKNISSRLVSPLSYFKNKITFWVINPSKLISDSTTFHQKLKSSEELKIHENDEKKEKDSSFSVNTSDVSVNTSDSNLFDHCKDLSFFLKTTHRPIFISKIEYSIADTIPEPISEVTLNGSGCNFFKKIPHNTYEIEPSLKIIKSLNFNEAKVWIKKKISSWREEGFKIFLSYESLSYGEISKKFFEDLGFQPRLNQKKIPLWISFIEAQEADKNIFHLLQGSLSKSLLFKEEEMIFLKSKDLLNPLSHHLPFYKRKIKKDSSTKITSSESLLKQSKALTLLEDLKRGDLVSHKLHGVGRFERMQTMNILGFHSEFLVLQYKENEKLYLPVHRISQIQKWSSSLSSTRILDKLGTDRWVKTKRKIKKKLRELAHELLRLYAKRLQIKRPPCVPSNVSSINSMNSSELEKNNSKLGKNENLKESIEDDYLKFENEFPYEETKDQKKAIEDVLRDMTERDTPMDRLICGDVGFGKTEVAMRAAFKAAQSARQVAMIVPTTILCFQHKESFMRRFKNWPMSIAALNRFVPGKEIKKRLIELKKGLIDIVIGTHRLLSQDVEFKNLGLLIIDEEQKFGVRHKEKIRKLKSNVDTIMISATPIPRTLDASLSGLRDISLILTPPRGRLSIRTFISRFNKELIKKACLNEVQRGGQILFIHNRVKSLPAKIFELRELLPHLRIGFAHGQMKEQDLEKSILSFFEKKIDLLVCTSIIESGMDIPKANTLFIDQAQHFGLSQLYQLRGRVGRSHERAFCYFLLDPHHQNKEVEERLRTLKEFSALGSGIQIAQKDLELRGGGNILGEEQSGHVHTLGYHLYMELLEEALKLEKQDQLKKKDPSGTQNRKEIQQKNEKELQENQEHFLSEDIDPEIRIPIKALIPESYIPSIQLRLAYYRELSRVKNKEDLSLIEEEMLDRFGSVPKSVYNLMNISWIQRLCKILKIKDLSLSSKKIHLKVMNETPLASDQAILFFQKEKKKYQLKPDNKLLICFFSEKENGEEKNEINQKNKEEETKILISEIKKELELLSRLFSDNKER